MARRSAKSRWANPEDERIAEILEVKFGFSPSWISQQAIDLYKANEAKRKDQQKCQQQNSPPAKPECDSRN